MDSIFAKYKTINEELYEDIEELLILADVGAQTAINLLENVRQRVRAERTSDIEGFKRLLIKEITNNLTLAEESRPFKYPLALLIIGVNGVGKTTSIGKLAYLFKSEGMKVIVAAADTFRAAAIDQLAVWCERCDVPMIRHQENSDPGAVVYDAIASAKSKKADILICDTAGRLQNKKNLMEELKKLFRIFSTQYPEAHQEVYLVLDASTGQNGLQQAKIFKEAAKITGIILTKLDGTAKGGIVIAIQSELKIPVKYICTGESIDDIQPFDAKAFAAGMFGE
jgi:fused signal recognition particle receptor